MILKNFKRHLVDLYPKIIVEIDNLVLEVADLIAELPPEGLLHRAWTEMATRHMKLKAEVEVGTDELLSMRMLDYVQSVIAAVPPSHNQRQEVTEEEWSTLREKIGILFDKVNRTYQVCRRAKNKAEDLRIQRGFR